MARKNLLSTLGALAIATATIAGCSSDDSPAASPTFTATGTASRTSTAPATATPSRSSTIAPSSTPTTTPVVASPTPSATVPASPPPNIVFIVLDDVGVDQLPSYGLGRGALPNTPNLDAIAAAGVKFTDAWSMPEGSPSRAAFFTGRYPLRTGATSALIPNMLPQAQLSPYEITAPRLLATAGYRSALVGKYHLGDANPAGFCAPQVCGWDYFEGSVEAGPPSIDEQAGQIQENPPLLVCGYDQRPAQAGACYTQAATVTSCGLQPNGRACLESGGLFVDRAQCETTSPDPNDPGNPLHVAIGDGNVILDFGRANGYYAWPSTSLAGALPPDTTDFDRPACGEAPLARTYMPTAQTNDAVAWYRQQSGPRMLSVSYSNIHTPYQKAPESLASFPPDGDLQCGAIETDRLLGDNMLEAVDAEIGRLLSELGLATLDDGVVVTTEDAEGNVRIPELDAAKTMLVVVGDNGTYAESVKEPFSAARSKGTVYQTGVWVPLLVAGSLVQGPTGRSEDALVNVVDLFELFGEIGGVDGRATIPPAHVLDSRPLLAYLTNPAQPDIREFNFTQLGNGVFESPQNDATRSWPCTLSNTCDDTLFDTQALCHTNAGVWWGPSQDPDPDVIDTVGPQRARAGVGSCCAVRETLALLDPPESTQIRPIRQFAARNHTYKVVELATPDCDSPHYDLEAAPPNVLAITFEFYDLTPREPANPVGLDSTNLLCTPAAAGDLPLLCPDGLTVCTQPESCLTLREDDNYLELRNVLRNTQLSEVFCPGDGNLDKRVTRRDLHGAQSFFGSGPSFFDLNFCGTDGETLHPCPDAKTNSIDTGIAGARMGTDCISACRRSDLNRDGVVDDADVSLLEGAAGTCLLCGADLNDDGQVNDADAQIMQVLLGCTYIPRASPTSRRHATTSHNGSASAGERSTTRLPS